jgi:protoporphyrinogen oxidase
VEHPLDGVGLQAAMAGGGILRTVRWRASTDPGGPPDDGLLLTVTLGGTGHGALLKESAVALIARAEAEVAPLLGVRGPPVLAEARCFPDSVPQPVAGHLALLGAAEDLESDEPMLALVGSWRQGPRFGDLLRGAVAAAERVAAAVAAAGGVPGG